MRQFELVAPKTFEKHEVPIQDQVWAKCVSQSSLLNLRIRYSRILWRTSIYEFPDCFRA